MKALCFGSLNIDHTYTVEHFVKKGETISSKRLQDFPGGKGLNQSVALAKAGITTIHAGMVGNDGKMLIDVLNKASVDTSLIKTDENIATGHAIIQIDEEGDNCILLFGGANETVSKDYIDEILAKANKDDTLVLQNEISNVPYIVEEAYKKGMYIVLNPSPLNNRIFDIDLNKINLFVLNEIEAAGILGNPDSGKDGLNLIEQLAKKYPHTEIMLTLGSEGSVYGYKNTFIKQESVKTNVVDTTAAGDTFLGYFVAGKIQGLELKQNLERASKAASIAISKKGASVSIPDINEIY